MTGLLHYYGQRVILDDFHSDNKKVYRLSNDELDADGAVDSVIDFYAFKGISLLVLSSEKKSTCFKGYVRYIFASLFFLSLTRALLKNFTSKAFFAFKKIKF